MPADGSHTPALSERAALKAQIDDAAERLSRTIDVVSYLRDLADHFESLEEAPSEGELRVYERTFSI